MARIDIMGIGIEYELIGPEGAPAVTIIPGGRFSKDAHGIPALGAALAAGGKRVLLWDRPSCGASDLSFEGNSESELHAEVLARLIRELGIGPTAVGGGSAGSRVAMLAGARHPEMVSHVMLWWLSGGNMSMLALGSSYCCEPAIAASMGGMEAVLALPFWAAMVKTNPSYRDIFLAMDPKAFIARMDHWTKAFVPNDQSPVPVMTADDYARLTMPVLIVRGSEQDLYHPKWVSEWVHDLIPHSTIVEAPWADDAFAVCMMEGARTGTGHFADWPNLAPQMLDFLDG